LCCDIQLVGSTVYTVLACPRKYCLNHVGWGMCVGLITADWRGRGS
jgi:hypothetical protein